MFCYFVYNIPVIIFNSKFLGKGMSDGALIETSGMPIEGKRPEKETKTETGGETPDQEEKRLLRERIRTLGA